MAFTDHCDIFLSVLEAGINRVAGHVRRQWPSLFNYGTAAIEQRPDLLFRPIDYHEIVALKHNPLITVIDTAPILGTRYALAHCVEPTDARVDFTPGNVFALPPQLGALGAQQFAAKVTVC